MLDPARDAMLVVEPAFPAYAKMAQLEGVARASASGCPPSTSFRYDVERILAAITPTTRLIVISSPANPTGRVITRDGDAALGDGAARARRRTGVGALR